jgi:hypothetical protein
MLGVIWIIFATSQIVFSFGIIGFEELELCVEGADSCNAMQARKHLAHQGKFSGNCSAKWVSRGHLPSMSQTGPSMSQHIEFMGCWTGCSNP